MRVEIERLEKQLRRRRRLDVVLDQHGGLAAEPRPQRVLESSDAAAVQVAAKWIPSTRPFENLLDWT